MTLNVTLATDVAYVFFTEEEDGEHSDEEVGETHAEDDGGVTNPVIPEINEIFWAAVFFFALWALMKYVLLPPLMAGRSEREDRIRAARDAADSVDADLGAATGDYEAKVGAARDEANAIIAQARDEADARRAELQGAADAEIAELHAASEAELATVRTTALGQMRGDVGDLAVGAASRVIGGDLDRASQQATIDRVLGS